MILPGEGLPVRHEEAHDQHQLGIDAKQLPDGAGLAEQLFPHRLSDDADAREPADILVGVRSTLGEWPALDGQVFGPDSAVMRPPVAVSEDDLCVAVDVWRDPL